MSLWNDSKIIAWDLETSGDLPAFALQPWRWSAKPKPDTSWVTSTSMIRHNGSALVNHGSKLYPQPEDLRAFLEEAIENDWTVLGWNITFDLMWLFAMGLRDLVYRVKWLDAMLLWRHLEIEPEYEFQLNRSKKKRYRLKPEGIERFVPTMRGYNDDIDFHATDGASLAKLQEYNDRDSVCTWVAAATIWESLTPEQRQCALIEAECLPMVAEANCRGMYVDTLACRDLACMLDTVACDMLSQLAPHGVTEQIVRSPKQLGELLYDVWKLPVLKENKSKLTGNTTRSTDKEVLHELAFKDPRAKQIKLFREALGNKAKFADGILSSVMYNGDGKTRPGAIVFGTYSGRLTYASKQGKGKDERPVGFALHQEKRDAEFRNVIIPPLGCTLVEFDASGQEYRWMAIASGDQTMLSLCQPGEDPHSFMGSRIAGRDYQEVVAAVAKGDVPAKATRQLGKVANLALQYRTSARKLRSVARVAYELPMELPEAQRIHATYQRTYPGVPTYWARQIALTRQCGYVETLAGRRVQVVGDWSGDWAWSMGSTSINYRIQGTGADQKYLAMQMLKPYLLGIGGSFAWDLHDGIYMYIPDAEVERAVVDIKRILDTLPYRQSWGFTPPIPLPWDCKTGKSWGGLKEWKFT